MKNILYSNGDICKYENSDGSHELALVFPSFADDNTILSIPLSKSAPSASIPFLVGGSLLYISYCRLFRIKNDSLLSVIGHIDSVGIEMVIQSISLAFKGELPNISIPVAILHDDEKPTDAVDKKSVAEINESESARKFKYTREDYDYIVNNYQTNMSMLLTKYRLKDKQALYKLKYTLQRRYGNASDNKEDSNDIAEEAGGE